MRHRTADVVVIGAGIVGLFVARAAALRGLSVLLLDSAGTCSGTSASSTAHLTTTFSRQRIITALAKDSLSRWTETASELGADLSSIETLVCAPTESEVAELRELHDYLGSSGIEAQLVYEPGSEHKALIDVPAYLRVQGDANVDAPAMGRLLALSLRALGSRFEPFAPVHRISLDGRNARVDYGADTALAPCVVVCCGVWTNSVLESIGLSLPIRPRKGHVALLSGAVTDIRMHITELSYMASTAPRQDAPVLVAADISLGGRGGTVCGSSREYAGYETRVERKTLLEIVVACARLVPSLRRQVLVGGFAGLRPATPDGFPFIDRAPSCPQVIVAAGHEGYGHTMAPVTAELVAQLITDPDQQPLALFSIGRLQGARVPQP